MSREIKFRAWYKDEKKMIYFDLYDYKTIEQLYMHNNSKEMQFTGLKDKNGVEIYEGDVLRFKNDRFTWIYICYFKDGIFIFEQVDDKSRYLSVDKVEVIGNIYENEDLLK